MNVEEKEQISSYLKWIELFLILVVVIIIVHYAAVPINGFFENTLGESLEAKFAGPLVEEFLKSLGIITLICIYSSDSLREILPNKKEVNFLSFRNRIYLVGIISGLLFGVFEDMGGYGFSGFRIATPFLHAIETGLVAIGIYFVVRDGKKGIIKLILIFISAFSIHSITNHLSLAGLVLHQAVLAVGATFIVFGTIWYIVFYQ